MESAEFEAVVSQRNTESWLSKDLVLGLQWALYCVMCQTVDIFGICTNTMNIICFVKLGFKDPINISLLGLAVSDLCCLTTLVWTNICFTLDLSTSDVPFVPWEFQFVTSALPHFTFSRITAWITAFITLERCLCITAPLRVKALMTRNRVSTIIACIYLLLISGASPVYDVYGLSMKWVPDRNKTLLGLVYREDRKLFEQASYATNNIFIPASAFLVIIMCTVILAYKLQQTSLWRKKSASFSQSESVSSRNQKVSKMVVMISTLFIACFTPVTIIFLAMSLEPSFSIDGQNRNIFILVGGLGILMESINSSVNIFIYYKMSSKFKSEYQRLFCVLTNNTLD